MGWTLIFWSIVGAGITASLRWIITSFLRPAKVNTAYIRTGLGEKKVFIESLAYQIPFLQHLTEIPLAYEKTHIRITQYGNPLISRDGINLGNIPLVCTYIVKHEPESVIKFALHCLNPPDGPMLLGKLNFGEYEVQEALERRCNFLARAMDAKIIRKKDMHNFFETCIEAANETLTEKYGIVITSFSYQCQHERNTSPYHSYEINQKGDSSIPN
jgi:uncharacterized membrane protein YqiK